MDSENLAPCPECREPVDGEARVCPHCRRSTLADVVLETSLDDGRSRYRTARALLALGEGVPTLTVLQKTLASGHGTLAYGVAPATAERAANIVRESGGQVSIRRAGEYAEADEGEGRSVPGWVGAALAVVVALGAAAFFLLSGDSPSSTPDASDVDSPPSVELSPEEVAARGLAATVALECEGQIGSGFFVTPDLLLTNAHVLCPGTAVIKVRFSDGRETQGAVESVDQALDLAVVRAPGLQGEPLRLGDAGALRPGQHLTMIGSPLGLEFTVHDCSVSSLTRHDLGLALVQIDAAVNPGNSGGPLVDRSGRAVGVVTLKMSGGEGIGLAVPVNYAFGGPDALLQGYAQTLTPGFAQMKARAENASQREAAELQAVGQRPGLVAAVTNGPLMMARLIWPSASPPWVQDFNFALVKGDERICTMTGEVSDWRKLEGEGGGGVLPPRMTLWLERHGFSADLYEGVAVMRWDHCPAERLDGIVDLEMENADDDARRVRFGG